MGDDHRQRQAEGGNDSAGKPNLNSSQSSASAKFASAFLIIMVACLAFITILSFLELFHWDEESTSSIFLWDIFVFFLTKGPALKIGGTAIIAFIGALIVAAAEQFKGRKTIHNIMWLCTAGLLLSILLWIRISRDDEVFGEVSAMAGAVYPEAPAERIAAVSSALDVLMGSLVLWWVIIVATILGLRAALNAGSLEKFRKFFTG